MTENILEISLTALDVHWAAESARLSAERWSQQSGHYPNYLSSHFKGKLGELAVEKFLLENGYQLDAHFRYPERENLGDIVVKIRRYSEVCRLEVKTWDKRYWSDLGRCIAVDQYEKIKKKADQIIWCVVQVEDLETLLNSSASVHVSLIGWSWVSDVKNAPIRFTGTDNMRKIENHQLNEADLYSMLEYKLKQ